MNAPILLDITTLPKHIKTAFEEIAVMYANAELWKKERDEFAVKCSPMPILLSERWPEPLEEVYAFEDDGEVHRAHWEWEDHNTSDKFWYSKKRDQEVYRVIAWLPLYAISFPGDAK